MTEQAQLFEPGHDGTVDVVPIYSSRSDRALALRELHRHPERYAPGFRAWLEANWPLWTAFCRLARAAQERGRTHYSARMLFHVIRFHSDIREAVPMLNGVRMPEQGFKLNNNRSATMARLFNRMDPANRDFFETRERLQ